MTSNGVGATIVVSNVSKWFGNVVAVNGVSLEINPGITGLLGPNGAGKTTLLSMITGLAAPSEGEVTVLGQIARENPDVYRRIGVMSEHQAVYEFLSGRNFVKTCARLQRIDDLDEHIDRAIDHVDMAEAQHRTISGYSRGMRQRMRLAAALVHDPQVLVLDEPLSGTDPRQRVEFQNLMRRLAGEGRTILMSSHILEEVETLSDSILLMVDGKLAAAGGVAAIRAQLDERPYTVRVVSDEPRKLAAALVGLDEVESVAIDGNALIVSSRNVAALQTSVPRLAQVQGIRLLRVEPLDDSLESVFGYVVEG